MSDKDVLLHGAVSTMDGPEGKEVSNMNVTEVTARKDNAYDSETSNICITEAISKVDCEINEVSVLGVTEEKVKFKDGSGNPEISHLDVTDDQASRNCSDSTEVSNLGLTEVQAVNDGSDSNEVSNLGLTEVQAINDGSDSNEVSNLGLTEVQAINDGSDSNEESHLGVTKIQAINDGSDNSELSDLVVIHYEAPSKDGSEVYELSKLDLTEVKVTPKDVSENDKLLNVGVTKDKDLSEDLSKNDQVSNVGGTKEKVLSKDVPENDQVSNVGVTEVKEIKVCSYHSEILSLDNYGVDGTSKDGSFTSTVPTDSSLAVEVDEVAFTHAPSVELTNTTIPDVETSNLTGCEPVVEVDVPSESKAVPCPDDSTENDLISSESLILGDMACGSEEGSTSGLTTEHCDRIMDENHGFNVHSGLHETVVGVICPLNNKELHGRSLHQGDSAINQIHVERCDSSLDRTVEHPQNAELCDDPAQNIEPSYKSDDTSQSQEMDSVGDEAQNVEPCDDTSNSQEREYVSDEAQNVEPCDNTSQIREMNFVDDPEQNVELCEDSSHSQERDSVGDEVQNVEPYDDTSNSQKRDYASDEVQNVELCDDTSNSQEISSVEDTAQNVEPYDNMSNSQKRDYVSDEVNCELCDDTSNSQQISSVEDTAQNVEPSDNTSHSQEMSSVEDPAQNVDTEIQVSNIPVDTSDDQGQHAESSLQAQGRELAEDSGDVSGITGGQGAPLPSVASLRAKKRKKQRAKLEKQLAKYVGSRDSRARGRRKFAASFKELLPAQEDEFHSDFTCPVCLDLFHRPHIVSPCQHMFCEPCLRKLPSSALADNAVCPLCRCDIVFCTLDVDLHHQLSSYYSVLYTRRARHEKKLRTNQNPLPRVYTTPLSQQIIRQIFRSNQSQRRNSSKVLTVVVGLFMSALLSVLYVWVNIPIEISVGPIRTAAVSNIWVQAIILFVVMSWVFIGVLENFTDRNQR